MKVAFVSQPGYAILPPAGSLEIWDREVARRLTARHELVIYGSSTGDSASRTVDGIEYRLVSHGRTRLLTRAMRLLWRLWPADRAFFSSPWFHALYWLRIARDVRREGFDAVHVDNYSQALVFLRRAAPSATLALHMHCEWLTQLDRRMIDRRLRRADLVIGCSDHITGSVRRRFPHHAGRCRTVYNGVELRPLPRRREATTVTVLHVGRISPEKGLHVLVEALNRIVPHHPEVRLVVVGEESEVPAAMAVEISDDPVVRALERFYGRSYLAELERRMSGELAERVAFTGRIRHSDTAGHYDASDIFVFPSIFESFGIPPLEAMAAGLPVVAARAGGVVETVVDGVTGLLVEREDPDALAEALVRLIRDPELRRTLGEAGRRRAAEIFSWSSIAEELERVLAEAAAPARPPAVPAADVPRAG